MIKKVLIYCDESHPMQNDGEDFMVLGALICKESDYQAIFQKISEIKKNNNIDDKFEFKWQKINKKQYKAYSELISYLAEVKNLYVKINVALGKRILSFNGEEHSYNTWYHRMYYLMLKNYIRYHIQKGENNKYYLYIDKKDTHSSYNYQRIASSLCKCFRSKDSFLAHDCNSKEHILIQCTDVIIGAVSYFHKKKYVSKYKTSLMKHIMSSFGVSFDKNTDINNNKISYYIWTPRV